ncbi:STY4526/YPO1902 family pathogenicity island replication protein [Cellvibrio sp. UBA7671]|uniref:STY4526/YPO1902 family pathogenicity island replication protein n=1 Tax=Cellvibrio sp. UBA7671 TaxID=1946312 RepID=UPI002F34F364
MMQNHYLALINQQILLAAADALRTQDAHLINQLGLGSIDETTANQLKQVSADRLACLSNFRGTLLDVRLNAQNLRIFLGFANDKVGEDDLINKAIRAGMRQTMLEELKGIGRREFSSRRERMGLPEHTRGRIEVLGESDELKVLKVWGKLTHISDPLERYLALHSETGIGLDQAYITIKQLA